MQICCQLLPSDDAAPNGARFLFLLDKTRSGRLDAFDVILDLFASRGEGKVTAAASLSRLRHLLTHRIN
jgi:hypothetical protein